MGEYMLVNIKLNGKSVVSDIAADMTLYDFVRKHGCYSVKCGCETSNCGLCTVFLDEKPVLSCSVLAVRADKCSVTTLEGIQEEASEFVTFIADQGAEQCGFCNPGFVMNAFALFRENPYPDENEIREYLSGNLCRCSGYEGQLRGILNYIKAKKDCMWQNNNLLSDHVYRITFDILDRSSNDGEEYFMSKHDIDKLNDSMNKLASDLKQAVLD